MTDKKTLSCECSTNKCKHVETMYFKRFDDNIKPSNLSTANCHTDSTLNDCSNFRIHKITVEPKHFQNDQKTILNKTGVVPAGDFCKIDNTELWGSRDPRLRVSALTEPMILDRPAPTTTIARNAIYDESMNNYGKNYKSYEDINGGHIQYYNGEKQSETYSEPNYVLKSKVTNSTFKDPMGGISPQFDRNVYLKNNNHISE